MLLAPSCSECGSSIINKSAPLPVTAPLTPTAKYSTCLEVFQRPAALESSCNLVDTNEFAQVFEECKIAADSKAAGRWETNKGGEYYAAGIGGAITGRGADLLIIDDPHSEQDALSETAMDSAYEWYTSGPRQRLQPGGAIVIVMTRWST